MRDYIVFCLKKALNLPAQVRSLRRPFALWGKGNMSHPALDEEVSEMESWSILNSALMWVFSKNGGPRIEVSPEASRQHAGLQILWNEERPERLRVNLTKSSPREIASRGGGEKLFLEYVPLGTDFEVAIRTASHSTQAPRQRHRRPLRSAPVSSSIRPHE